MRKIKKKLKAWYLRWSGILERGKELKVRFDDENDVPANFCVRVFQEHFNQTGEMIIGNGKHAKLVSTGNKPTVYRDRKQAASGE